jgi:hypothetical protein
MELTQQVATLQDEVKLLKGEIKAILKEMRAALLNRDNPFAADAPPVFRPVARSNEEQADEAFNAGLAALEAPPLAQVEPAAQQPIAPAPAAADPHQGPVLLPVAQPAPGAQEPLPAPVPEPAAPRWDLLTIASLTAWAEDALATLGPKRFQVVLELACFAELLTPDVRDVLAGLAELMPEQQKRDERPLHVNESLVVLRQLEAILQGEKVTKLPRRRGARRVR